MATFFDLCGDIWGGSSATVVMPHGIESGETNTVEDESIGDVNDDVYLQELADGDIPSSSTTEPSRSKKMTTFLKERRNKVVQKKIPVDQQLLTIAREELNFKKEMMEHMKKEDEDFNQNIRSMQMSLNNFTGTMAHTFQSMVRMMAPQPQQPTFEPTHFSPYQSSYLSPQSVQSPPPLSSIQRMEQRDIYNPENR